MIVSLTGPSGIGKGYLREVLLAHFSFLEELVWLTTRSLRPNELSQPSNRKTVSPSLFNALNAARELSLVQNIHGHFYGIENGQLKLCAQGAHLTEFQIDNIEEAIGFGYPIIALALLPKTMDFLRKRLTKRDTESITETEQRLIAAETETRKIVALKPLFAMTAMVDESSERQISEVIIDFLTPILQRSSR